MTSIRGATVIVTGANQGVGKETARALAAAGARVVLVCRNETKAKSAAADIKATTGSSSVSVVVADLASQADVRRAAEELLVQCPRIDVLVNNAGVLVPTRQTSGDGIELTWATNHLAPFLLTQLLLDRLVASGSPESKARVVNVGSEAHRKSQMHWDDLQFAKGYRAFTAYGQSKLANLLFTYELARRLEGRAVTVNCLHPGTVASGFGQTYGGMTSLFFRAISPFLRTAADGAKGSVYLASSPEVANVSGRYFHDCRETRSSAVSCDEVDARRLWELSELQTSNRGGRTETLAS